MNRYFVIAALIASGIYGFGCTKKSPMMEESQELLSMEQMSTVAAPANATQASAVNAALTAAPVSSKMIVEKGGRTVDPTVAANLEPLPPAGPYKPTGKDIQTALKNAGFYTGTVDGRIGPMTKEAVEDFQKANGLEADGRVGPKTWASLSRHLNKPALSVEPSLDDAK